MTARVRRQPAQPVTLDVALAPPMVLVRVRLDDGSVAEGVCSPGKAKELAQAINKAAKKVLQ